jgi:cyclophilin family peptidyl-prolyl cis-trans isomerase
MKKTILLFLVIFTGISMIGFSQAKKAPEKRTKILIHTDMGDIKVVLYNETPKHRDNFIKLVKEGWYDGSIFHRVISNFMIQGGMNKDGKTQDPGYTVPAEFNTKLFHKRGALAAARTENPEKASSGSQFYIVQGTKFDDNTLNAAEQRTGHKFLPEQREYYKTKGGTPHLDGGYTVFGEVVEGMDVVDKIAAVKTVQPDKPIKDIKMSMKIIQ